MNEGFSIDRRCWQFLSGLCAAILILGVVGCEDNRDHYRDYNPPAGKGSLVIDNMTADDIVDLAPGQCIVFLDGEHSSRDKHVTVDILNGRLTVLRVRAEVFGNNYDVEVDHE